MDRNVWKPDRPFFQVQPPIPSGWGTFANPAPPQPEVRPAFADDETKKRAARFPTDVRLPRRKPAQHGRARALGAAVTSNRMSAPLAARRRARDP